ncbi:response regulator [Paenibacillus sp. N4]|uniref:response regulator n=1 Tax=Paenibacillus vietnamensis TaxID=2590547 RepID=UPI001CD0AC6A|nr:response regulator [Paenibacillus vietnamensis]MCA0755134.1 response regulator [Paenibacillus vietnamensis]
MIRIVLADDEPIIIKGLRKLIDWEAFGMEIVGQAYDGNELMDLIDRHMPDLVISDISMPHRTGIEIIKELKEKEIPVKVIFISAYQEFSYARDAVAYGAIDYLVKPVVKQQLEAVLEKALSMISQHHEEERRKGKLQLLERKNRHEELQDALIRLTDGNLSPNTSAFREAAAGLKGPLITIMLIEAERLKDSSDRWTEKERKLVEFAIGNVLQEVVQDPGAGYVFVKKDRHAVIVNHDSGEQAAGLADEIRDKIWTFLKIKVSIALSRPAAEAERLAEAYREAEQALEMKFYAGLGRILPYNPLQTHEARTVELYELQWAVIRSMTEMALEDVEAALDEWLETIKKETFGNRSLTVSTCFSSMLFIIGELSKSGVQLPGRFLDKRELQDLLASYETFEIMSSQVKRLFRHMCEEMDSDSGNKDKIVLAKVKQYIEEHFAEEITLESIAGMAFMNPYYFSSFFKKHTKQNFKQYLTEVRMKNASQLLRNTDLMIYEVAEKVGYNNARHFSDMFKKMYGKLPIDYRQDGRR